MEFELKTVGDWSYYYIPELEKARIVHGFFTKNTPSHTMVDGRQKEKFLTAFSKWPN